jgi:hypothetical protein
MSLQSDLFELERRFWMEGEAYFTLATDAVLVFADPVGMLDRDGAIGAIGGAPRWRKVNFAAPVCRKPSDDSALVAYEAATRRDGDASDYRAMAGTVYVREGGAWKLAFHQQTPHPR